MAGLTPLQRRVLQGVGAGTLLSAAFLYWYGKAIASEAQSILRGEEVYASHDCTDCHLPVNVLRQKKDRREQGLIRNRRSVKQLVQLLENDNRHRSFLLMAENDRADLLAYLRSLIP